MSVSTDAHNSKVLPPSKLAHVVLRTNNYSNMIKFYSTFLGASIAFSNERVTFMSYDDEHHRIGIINIPSIGPKNPQTSGLEHIAFTFDSLETLVQSWKQRKSHGIQPFWTVNHGVTISAYYRDPDGNTIETQIDLMSPDEANQFMYSKEFALNPIGVDVDLGELVKRIESGENPAEVLKRPDIGPRTIESVPGFVQ